MSDVERKSKMLSVPKTIEKRDLSVAKTIEKKARSKPADAASSPRAPSAAKKSRAADCLRATARDAGEVIDLDADAPDAGSVAPNESGDGVGGAASSTQSLVDAAEYASKSTSDKLRVKVRGLLLGALHRADEDYATKGEAETIANAIEQALFDRFEATDQQYRTKFRELSFNFKDVKNGPLRANVLERALAPSKLVTMASKDLANEELKKDRDKVREKMTREAMPYAKEEASTDMFRCGKCGKRKCTYYQMQTRSADEPLTTFVRCVLCKNRWRF